MFGVRKKHAKFQWDEINVFDSDTDAAAAGATTEAAAGAAAGAAGCAAAAFAAASAVCIYHVGVGGRFAPTYRYMMKYIQQKQQQKQQLKQQQHLCLNKKHLLTLNKNIFKR